ncbi:MAG: molybdopterin-dependent oxidoreductase [Candidatus Nanopelagicales bacterium]
MDRTSHHGADDRADGTAVDGRPPDTGGSPVGRRVVLGMLGLGALGVLGGSAVARGVSSLFANDPTGITSLLPGAGGFRFYSVTSVQPERTKQDYRLTVGGLVDRPRELTFSDLGLLPQTGITADFQCVTGWRVDDVPWKGVLLRDVLDLVGVQDAATAVRFTSFDGVYTESLTLDQAMRDDVLVATGMLGAEVRREHGGPVRLYVAPMYGYKSLKWLGGIELTAEVKPGYWELRGYDIDAWVGSSNGRVNDEPIA